MKGKCPRNKTRINLSDQLFKKSPQCLSGSQGVGCIQRPVPMQPCLPSKIIMMISICIYIYYIYVCVPVIHSRITMIICICPLIPVMLHSYVKFPQGIIQHLFISAGARLCIRGALRISLGETQRAAGRVGKLLKVGEDGYPIGPIGKKMVN